MMSQFPHALWVNVNPNLRRFDQPLLNILSQHTVIAEWEYCQTPDEPASLEIALVLLEDYLKQCDHPVHLLGHGTGGLISWLYTLRHPKRVKSLTLLSVGANPAVDWQAYYFEQLNLLPCSREILLTQMVYNLFGRQCPVITRKYRKILDQDLGLSLSPHNLYQRLHISPKTIPVPLLVCGGEHDVVISSNLWQKWKSWLKEGDRLWQCLKGRYFFHASYPHRVSYQIEDFWDSLVSVPASTYEESR